MPSTKVRTAGVVFELLVPTPRMNKEGRAALGVTRSPPTKEVRSSVLWTTATWRLSEENAWSEIGTSCATSARRCAVTTNPSTCPDEPFWAGAAVLGPAYAPCSTTSPEADWEVWSASRPAGRETVCKYL